MRYLGIVLILLLAPNYSYAQDTKWLRVAQVSLVVGQGLDLYSTHEGFEKGYVESNPLLGQNIVSIALLKASVTTTTIVFSEWLWKKGKKKSAILVLVGGAAIGCAAFMHNEYVIHEQRMEAIQKARSFSFSAFLNF